MSGEFAVGTNPEVAGAVVVAVWGNNGAVAGGVDQALVGDDALSAALVVGAGSHKRSGHGLNITPTLGFPSVVFGLLLLPRPFRSFLLLLSITPGLRGELVQCPVLPLVGLLNGFQLKRVSLLGGVEVVFSLLAVAVVDDRGAAGGTGIVEAVFVVPGQQGGD